MRDVLSVGSLFSGIGGFDLGLERAGMRVAWQCEADLYCRAVLSRHWPDVPCYEDVRDVGGDAPRVDLVAGGFPCQPISRAGRGKAQADPRWLWPEFARVVGEIRPRYVLVENVPELSRRGLTDVLGDLAALGFDAEWETVSAAALGAPHLRERLFLVAYAQGPGAGVEGGKAPRTGRGTTEAWGAGLRQGYGRPSDLGAPAGGRGDGPLADSDGTPGYGAWPAGQAVFRPEEVERFRRRSGRSGIDWSVEPDVGRVAHGIPARLDRLRALGNAVVPQVAEFVGRLILEAHERNQ